MSIGNFDSKTFRSMIISKDEKTKRCGLPSVSGATLRLREKNLFQKKKGSRNGKLWMVILGVIMITVHMTTPFLRPFLFGTNVFPHTCLPPYIKVTTAIAHF